MVCTRSKFSFSFALSSVLLLVAMNTVASAGDLRTVALSGQHAPGTPIGTNYWFFNNPPVLNVAGLTSFEAHFIDKDANNSGEGIWSEGSGTLQLVARERSQAPNAPSGASFVSFSTPNLNDTGQLAFGGHSSSSVGTSFSGIWKEQLGNVEAVILGGNQAPGTPSGVSFRSLINGIVLMRYSIDIHSQRKQCQFGK